MSDQSTERVKHRRAGWGVAAIFGATLAAYFPALTAGFIWDDDGFVTRTVLRSWHGLWRIWFEPGATEQYYPVLHSAFWLEYRLWGGAALGYHLANIVLHATAACLFAMVLRRLWGSGEKALVLEAGAWVAGMIFALHPVCVESVAWIAEQKNTLSTVFYLLAALAYLRFDEQRRGRASKSAAGDGIRGLISYGLATGWFVLALLSKTATVTLPAALLVVVWWRHGRLSWRRDAAPLAPWFALSAAAGLVTMWVEHTFIGAQGAAFALGFTQRWLLVGRQIWFYLGKLVWPAHLIFIYPRWRMEAAGWWQGGYLLGVVALTAALWWWRRRSRAPLAAWLFFVGSLFPTLGFFNVYGFVFSYVADHWQYLASLGVIALAAGGWERWRALKAGLDGPEAAGPSATDDAPAKGWLPIAVASAAIGVLGVLTWRQCVTYHDAETFYRRTLEQNPDCWMAHDNLGVILAGTGRLPEALRHYEEALRLNPDLPEIYNNRGNALAKAGQLRAAMLDYARALQLRPGFGEVRMNLAEAHYELGNTLANAGRLADAVAEYGEALRLRPDFSEALANRGLALAETGRSAEAIANLERALRLNPTYAEAHAYLGDALVFARRLPEAVAQYQKALELNPNDADVHYHLGLAWQQMGRTDEAKVEFDRAERKGSAP